MSGRRPCHVTPHAPYSRRTVQGMIRTFCAFGSFRTLPSDFKRMMSPHLNYFHLGFAGTDLIYRQARGNGVTMRFHPAAARTYYRILGGGGTALAIRHPGLQNPHFLNDIHGAGRRSLPLRSTVTVVVSVGVLKCITVLHQMTHHPLQNKIALRGITELSGQVWQQGSGTHWWLAGINTHWLERTAPRARICAGRVDNGKTTPEQIFRIMPSVTTSPRTYLAVSLNQLARGSRCPGALGSI